MKLGLLTSGGDCAGLNAVIRAVTHAATLRGWTVIGILDGTLGLIERPLRCRTLTPAALEGPWLREAGTVLGTVNRGDPFHFRLPSGERVDRSQAFAEGARQLGLDALIVVGGDGSMAICARLCASAGLPMMGVPKTIDNDVHGTDCSVGFDSAVRVATEALDRLQPTAASHHRVMVLETMGRTAGHIAMHAGVAGAADAILVPELDWTVEGLFARIAAVMAGGRSHALVVVAEGARGPCPEVPAGGMSAWVSAQLAQRSGLESRVTVLGHVQRGGEPSAQDRLLAASLGVAAVDGLAQGRQGCMVAWHHEQVIEVPLVQVNVGPRRLDPDSAVVRAARGLGIYIGEPQGSTVIGASR